MHPPEVSVLIACVNGMPVIEECLACLQPGLEVIVVDFTRAPIREKFPWVRFVDVPVGTSIPRMRTIGLEQSHGDIVVVIEDHCLAEPGWAGRIVAAHAAHPECVAIGGAVENGSCERLTDWAVFFCEYSRFMPPLREGPGPDITGNNVSYKRAAFAGIPEDVLAGGFWESTLHPRLLEGGARFYCDPSIVVRHKKEFGFAYFVSQRYHYSRYYAGRLAEPWGVLRRIARGAASLALPAVLLARIASNVKSHRKELLLSLPLLAVFTGVWAFGEVVGCLFGPGDSLGKIE
jgi:glycosyltransferase involved in cell wall biosynthesis